MNGVTSMSSPAGRHAARWLIVLAAAITALFALAGGASSRSAAPAAKAPPARLLVHVHARIRAYASLTAPRDPALATRVVTFVPKVINVGTVIIDVINSDQEPHWLEINGVRSKRMGEEGGRSILRVTFKRPGNYPVALTSEAPINFTGSLKVVR
jgi:hypothetical protein